MKYKKEECVRVNYQIRISQIQLVDEKGQNIGVVSTSEALRKAQLKNLDLVEVAPNVNPPVCKIMDYGKYKYQQSKKDKKTKKVSLKEIRFRVSTEQHDIDTKMKSIRKFISQGHKVQISVRFKARENAFKHLGFELLKKLLTDLEDVVKVQQKPKLTGKSAICIIEPK